MTRRSFLAFSAAAAAQPAAARRPNVILIMSDDQGYGDLSIHGNTHLQTPNMDRIAKEGVQFTQFQVCPVCSPTRASLMTGRYNYRTGVVDTFRDLLQPRLSQKWPPNCSSRPAITPAFSEWHLGDNYPMRAHDQGFNESLVHGGGGLLPAQCYPPPGNHDFDPTLLRNGKFEKVQGHCTRHPLS